jgi:hypothetical protein
MPINNSYAIDDNFSNISSGCSSLSIFADAFRPIHGYLSIIVCSIGVPLNLLNIIVLTRQKLKYRPTNLILTFLATSDLITMLSNFFYIFWFNLWFPILGGCNYNFPFLVNRDTHFWTVYKAIHVNLSVTVHSFSVWLTVFLAVFRYIVIKKQAKQKNTKKSKIFFKNFTSYKTCLKMIVIIGIFCLLFCSPAYFLYYVDKEEFDITNDSVIYVYTLKETKLNQASNGNLFKFTFYLQSVLAKLLPCVSLVSFTMLLINSLVKINRNKRRLKKLPKLLDTNLNYQEMQLEATGIRKNKRSQSYNIETRIDRINERSRVEKIRSQNQNIEHLRTTLMLIMICILFIIAELPQSILLFVSIIFHEQKVYEHIYMPLGDLMDIIVLFNSSINFILYCTMSCVFRSTFYNLITNTLRNFQSFFEFKKQEDRNDLSTNTVICYSAVSSSMDNSRRQLSIKIMKN